MVYQVILTQRAKADLQALAEYIALDNPAAAENFVHKLLDDALSLACSPLRGQTLKRKPTIRRLVRWPYLVYYRVETSQSIVRILRFWHGARHPKTPRFND